MLALTAIPVNTGDTPADVPLGPADTRETPPDGVPVATSAVLAPVLAGIGTTTTVLMVQDALDLLLECGRPDSPPAPVPPTRETVGIGVEVTTGLVRVTVVGTAAH